MVDKKAVEKHNQTKDTVVQVVCSTCNIETNHIVLQSVEHEILSEILDSEHYNEPISIDYHISFQIIKCQGCDSISFRKEIECSEYEPGDLHVFLYPHRSETTKPIKDYFHVPKNIKEIYIETIECFNHDQPYLCAAGLRAIVEGICADQKITDGPFLTPEGNPIKNKKTGLPQRNKDLYCKIAGLVEKGILTKKQANILHVHRELGNDALHKLQLTRSRVSRAKELSLAIEVVEQTLNILYETPKMGDELNSLREKRKASIKNKILP